MSDDFDVGRIVPSTRDLVAGLAMRRRSLSLVPWLDAADPTAPTDAERLAEHVRAFATDADGAMLRALARAAGDVPLLSTRPCHTALEIQRARYFGADGVVLADEAPRLDELLHLARSMHLTPLVPRTRETAERAAVGARAWLVDLEGDALVDLAAMDPRAVLVVFRARSALEAEAARALLGVVDALIVPPSLHRAAGFDALVDELDG